MKFTFSHLSITQAALYAGVSPSKLLKWVRRGCLELRVDGKSEHPYIDADDLIDFLTRKNIPIPFPLDQGRRFTALIVEDNLQMAHAIERVFHRLGFWTMCARDLPSSAEVLAEGLPDFITVDINLTGGNGVDILSSLVAAEADKLVSIIVITGLPASEVRSLPNVRSIEVLSKPFTAEALIEKITRLMPLEKKTARVA